MITALIWIDSSRNWEMAIFNRIRAAFRALTRESVDLNDQELLQWLGIDGTTSKKAIAEATYYACIKML